jgi:hypothetical protein
MMMPVRNPTLAQWGYEYISILNGWILLVEFCVSLYRLVYQVNGEMGTGTVVWDSSEALAEFLSVGDGYGSAGLTGKRVLEVGAGVSGLPGIAALLGGTPPNHSPTCRIFAKGFVFLNDYTTDDYRAPLAE